MFGHGSVKWSEWQDFHLRPPGPKPGALKTELHSVKSGGLEGSCTLVAVRKDLSRRQRGALLIELRIQ
jgi:hypothetical protein